MIVAAFVCFVLLVVCWLLAPTSPAAEAPAPEASGQLTEAAI